MLQFDIWQIAVDHVLPKLFTVDYLNCVPFCLTGQLWSASGHNKQNDKPIVKILTVMTRAHDGHAECRLNYNVYDISVICEF